MLNFKKGGRRWYYHRQSADPKYYLGEYNRERAKVVELESAHVLELEPWSPANLMNLSRPLLAPDFQSADDPSGPSSSIHH